MPLKKINLLRYCKEALILLMISLAYFETSGQNNSESLGLSEKHKGIILMAAFTAKGDLENLKPAIYNTLDAGLTINECKEVFLHTYAYCGFPRSIQGLNTLMIVLQERTSKGINDVTGREATPLNDTDKYVTGWKNLEKLSGRSADGQVVKPSSGYGAFSPEMDRFLKEHLFADLFSRDLLTFLDRELIAISVLISLGKGVEPMLGSHLGLTMKQGFSKDQLNDVINLFENSINKADAVAARKILTGINTVR